MPISKLGDNWAKEIFKIAKNKCDKFSYNYESEGRWPEVINDYFTLYEKEVEFSCHNEESITKLRKLLSIIDSERHIYLLEFTAVKKYYYDDLPVMEAVIDSFQLLDYD